MSFHMDRTFTRDASQKTNNREKWACIIKEDKLLKRAYSEITNYATKQRRAIKNRFGVIMKGQQK